jgi:hypothetical protein
MSPILIQTVEQYLEGKIVIQILMEISAKDLAGYNHVTDLDYSNSNCGLGSGWKIMNPIMMRSVHQDLARKSVLNIIIHSGSDGKIMFQIFAHSISGSGSGRDIHLNFLVSE